MFSLTELQSLRIRAWSKEQDKKAAELQKKDTPYYGAIGGALTYSFTPTSLGVIIKVKHAITDEVIDVTDYHKW